MKPSRILRGLLVFGAVERPFPASQVSLPVRQYALHLTTGSRKEEASRGYPINHSHSSTILLPLRVKYSRAVRAAVGVRTEAIAQRLQQVGGEALLAVTIKIGE